MGILSIFSLFISLMIMLVFRDWIKFSLFVLLVSTGIIFGSSMGTERAFLAVMPLVLVLVSFLVCDRGASVPVSGMSLIKSIIVSAGAVMLVYINKYFLAVIDRSFLEAREGPFDPAIFYLLPFVVVMGAVIINEVGYGPDFDE